MAAFFLVAGVAALVVGVHDVSLSGGRLGVLFPSVLLVVAGILFVGAVWRLIPIARPRVWQKGERRCKEPMPAAFLVSILLGVYVFFGALAGAGAQQAIVISVSLVFMAAGVFGFVLFWHEIKEVSAARVSAGVALSVVGLAIGAWEFWYQNQYRPSHLDRAVSVQVSLKKLGVQKGYDVFMATLGYQDIGDRAVVVLGSDYTLTGSRIVACQRQPYAKNVAGYLANALADPQRSRLMSDVWEVQPSTVLAAGRFVADGRRLAPNVPGSRQLVLYVPHSRYQLLRLRAQVFAISATVPLAYQTLRSKPSPSKPSHPIGPPSIQPLSMDIGDNELYDLWKLGKSSWFQHLLSGRRGWIVTRYQIAQNPQKGDHVRPSPDLRVTARIPGPSWSGSPPSSAQIPSLFSKAPPLDTTETFADTELAHTPVAAPTAEERQAGKLPCPTNRKKAAGQ